MSAPQDLNTQGQAQDSDADDEYGVPILVRLFNAGDRAYDDALFEATFNATLDAGIDAALDAGEAAAEVIDARIDAFLDAHLDAAHEACFEAQRLVSRAQIDAAVEHLAKTIEAAVAAVRCRVLDAGTKAAPVRRLRNPRATRGMRGMRRTQQ